MPPVPARASPAPSRGRRLTTPSRGQRAKVSPASTTVLAITRAFIGPPEGQWCLPLPRGRGLGARAAGFPPPLTGARARRAARRCPPPSPESADAGRPPACRCSLSARALLSACSRSASIRASRSCSATSACRRWRSSSSSARSSTTVASSSRRSASAARSAASRSASTCACWRRPSRERSASPTAEPATSLALPTSLPTKPPLTCSGVSDRSRVHCSSALR